MTDSQILDAIASLLASRGAAVPVPPAPLSGTRTLYTGVTHEYSSMYCGNIDHRAFLLQHPSGFIGLHTDDGKLHKILPSFVNHSAQPRWSRKKPTVFRYFYLNELREFDVANDQTITVKKFGFPNINGMGESDTSEDDDHIVLCSGQHVFVYEISTDRITVAFDAPAAFNNLYLTSQNEPIIGFYDRGVQVYRQGQLVPLAAKLGHMDCSSDAQGNPIIVWCNSADASGLNKNAALAGCPNGVVKIDVMTGKQTCVLSLDWSLDLHISLPDHARFAVVSTFDPDNPTSTVQYANENLQVWLDSVNGSHVDSLGKHGSNADIYARQPKASVSPDGTRYVYDSNGNVYAGMT